MPERRSVLITRPEPDAAETAQLVAQRGFEPVLAPVAVIRHRAVVTKSRFDAVVLTSRNAVPALPAWYRHLPLLAVGSATAAKARQAGFATVLDADGDALALAELTRRRLPRRSRLLFVHGAGQGDALAAALRGSDFAVSRRCGYTVTSVRRFPPDARAALLAGHVRSAMFLSAETARVFVRLLPGGLRPLVAEVDAVAIGAAAADALAPLPWHRVRVSLKPTLDQVLALL